MQDLEDVEVAPDRSQFYEDQGFDDGDEHGLKESQFSNLR